MLLAECFSRHRYSNTVSITRRTYRSNIKMTFHLRIQINKTQPWNNCDSWRSKKAFGLLLWSTASYTDASIPVISHEVGNHCVMWDWLQPELYWHQSGLETQPGIQPSLWWLNMITYSGPIYLHRLTLITARISNYMPRKVWDEITYSFLNFNSCTVEV